MSPGTGSTRPGVSWRRGFLRGLAGEGRTVLVSSHLLAEVAQLADQVIVIDRGRLVSSGPVSQLTATSGQAVVVRTPRAAELRAALEAECAPVRELADGRLEITGAGTEQVATPAAARGVPDLPDQRAGRDPGRRLPQAHRGPRKETGMSAPNRAEFLTLRTTKTAVGLAGLAVAVTALIAALASATAGTGRGMGIPSLATSAGLRDALASTGFALFMVAAVLGTVITSGRVPADHRHRHLPRPARPQPGPGRQGLSRGPRRGPARPGRRRHRHRDRARLRRRPR